MFGLEDQSKKKKSQKPEYDLEKDLQDPKFFEETTQHIRGRMQELKNILRSGENEDEFHKLGTLLHGYVSLIKVAGRVREKKKTKKGK